AAAAASRTGIGDHLPAPVTARARLLDREETLLHAHLPVTAARCACRRLCTGLRTAAVACFAFLHCGNANAGFRAACRVFQSDFEVVPKIRTPVDGRPRAASAEDVAEDVPERVGESAESARPRSRAWVHAGMTVLVVRRALLALRQDLVGLFV